MDSEKRMSTVDAINRALKISKKGIRGIREKRTCALISLAVQNAFNTASWSALEETLRRKGLSRQIITTLRSYMSEREIQVPTGGGGVMSLPVRAGVPEGSVLGTTLWNNRYDGVLTLNLPAGIDMIAYADDVALIASSRSVPKLKSAVRDTIGRGTAWMSERGLRLALQKTEAVILTKGRYDNFPTIMVDDHAVLLLGDQIPRSKARRQPTLHQPHRRGCGQGGVGCARHSQAHTERRMPSLIKRKMLMMVATSRPLYAALVRASSPMTAKSINTMARVNRLAALGLIRAYRTASWDTTAFWAGSIPLDLVASERAQLWTSRRKGLSDEDYARRSGEIISRTLALWQERWSLDNGKASWRML